MRQGGICLALATLLVLCGCTATPGTSPGTASPTPVEDGTPTTDADDHPPVHPSYESYVFDHAGVNSPVIEGGIQYAVDGNYATRYYVTTVTTRSQADIRLNETVLDEGAREFIAKTSFANASLVVVQHFPASSVPDYRVESVDRDGGTLHIGINDSSWGGTADITVETVLLRVHGEMPDRVRVTTEEGHTFDTTTGVVTVTPAPTPTPEPSIELPYRSENSSENVATPRGITLDNEGDYTVGYRLSVTYHEVPDCLDATPPCARPSRLIDVLDRTAKLPANQSRSLSDLVRRVGNYTVEVSASFPAADGSRTTVTESVTWRIDENARDLVVTFDSGNVSIARTEAA